MSIRINYACNGCFTEVGVRVTETQEVLSSGHVIGGVVCDRVLKLRPSIEDAAPEGWVAFDPYTGMTYCPECWATIVPGGDSE